LTARTQIISNIERLIYLKSIPGAAGLDSLTLSLMISQMNERRYKAGDKIISADKCPTTIHTIVEGSAEVHAPDGQRYVAGPRQDLGFGLILSRSETSVDIIALEDTLTLECPADVIFDTFENNFDFARQMITATAQMLLEIRKQNPLLLPEAVHDANIVCPARRLDLIEKLIVMRIAAPFRGRHLDGLMEMARRSHESRLAPGDRLWLTGEKAREINMLMCGEVYCRMEDGREFTLRRGQPVGNVEALAGQPRWYDAHAGTECVMLRLDIDAYFDVMEDRTGMMMDMIAFLTKNLVAMQSLIPDQPVF
jgi:CRP-like cAMP-binding protein